MEAAGSVVAGILRPVEFAGHDDFERDPLFGGKGGCIRQLGAGQAGRIGDDGQHVAAQGLVRRPGKKGRVHAARVGDQGPSQAAKILVEQATFGGEIGFGWHRDILRRLAGWRELSVSATSGQMSVISPTERSSKGLLHPSGKRRIH